MNFKIVPIAGIHATFLYSRKIIGFFPSASRSLFPTCIHGAEDSGGSAKPVFAKWKMPEGLLLKNRGVLIFEDPLMDSFKTLDPVSFSV